MKCPIDGTELRVAERQGIEIDYCPQCRGVWLDRGELDKILEREMQYSAPPARGYDAPAAYGDDEMRGAKRKNDAPYLRERNDDDDGDERRYTERYDDDSNRRQDPRRKKSFLGELFDVFD